MPSYFWAVMISGFMLELKGAESMGLIVMPLINYNFVLSELLALLLSLYHKHDYLSLFLFLFELNTYRPKQVALRF